MAKSDTIVYLSLICVHFDYISLRRSFYGQFIYNAMHFKELPYITFFYLKSGHILSISMSWFRLKEAEEIIPLLFPWGICMLFFCIVYLPPLWAHTLPQFACFYFVKLQEILPHLRTYSPFIYANLRNSLIHKMESHNCGGIESSRCSFSCKNQSLTARIICYVCGKLEQKRTNLELRPLCLSLQEVHCAYVNELR